MQRSLAVFAVALAAGGLAAVALGWGLPRLPVPMALGLAVLPVAGLLAGESFARRAGRAPTPAETASFTVSAMMLAVLATVALVWGLLARQGLPLRYQPFAEVFLRQSTETGALHQWIPFWMELAPWLAMALIWLGFRQGVRLAEGRGPR